MTQVNPSSQDGRGVEDRGTASDTVDKNKNPKLIRETLEFWQPRTSRKLTEEDARQIIQNTVGFFRVLHEWDRADKAAQNRAGSPDETSE